MADDDSEKLTQANKTIALLERKVTWLETNFELLLSILSKPLFRGSADISDEDFNKDVKVMRGVRQDFLDAQKKLMDLKTDIDPKKVAVPEEIPPLEASIKKSEADK